MTDSGETNMNSLKKTLSRLCGDEDGFVIVAGLLVLALVTIIGVMSVRTSSEDIDISTNNLIYQRSFYAAEAARAYVRNSPMLYGSGNITTGAPVNFPDAANQAATEPVVAGSPEEFNGAVEYLNASNPPRGSGYQIGKFRSHVYKMTCRGHGPRNSMTLIEAGFYRIGF
jgi:hypothetical protein